MPHQGTHTKTNNSLKRRGGNPLFLAFYAININISLTLSLYYIEAQKEGLKNGAAQSPGGRR